MDQTMQLMKGDKAIQLSDVTEQNANTTGSRQALLLFRSRMQ